MSREGIENALASLEAEHGFRILYACESGSRAWGFASADSDYDVRYIYVWPLDHYLGIFDPPDTIDSGVDENLLDLTGWDLRKALPLFRKANGSLFEWLHSPIIYRQDAGVMRRWRELATGYFVPRSSAAHYLGLSGNIWRGLAEGGSVTAKRYLYVLRSLLAARSVVENGERIPVAFSELRSAVDLPPEVDRRIDQMIAAKSTTDESDSIDRDEVLDAFIEAERGRLDPLVGELPAGQGSVEGLDEFFRAVVKSR